MDDCQYAYDIFEMHFRRACVENPPKPFTVVELGPGDSLCAALVARALGCSKMYLVDAGRFATDDLAPYHRMAAHLRALGRPVAGIEDCKNVQEILALCSAEYLSDGVASFAAIASNSVDFVFSNAVLEHIRLRDFVPLCRELRRVQHQSGAGSHTVDFRDHLQDSLNNLRFNEPLWESAFISSSGFYTNRIRPNQMLEMMREAGFQVEVLATRHWPAVPIERRKLAKPFRELPEEELRTCGYDMLLR